MKKAYQAPVTEIVELNVVDTVATSGPLTNYTPAFGPDGRDGMGN